MKTIAAISLALTLSCAVPVLAQAQSHTAIDTQRAADQADRQDKGEGAGSGSWALRASSG